MSKKKTPWWKNCQWHVETMSIVPPTVGKWVAIYMSATKAKANADAREWTSTTGQITRVVPGPGHRTLRNLTP